MSLAELKQRVVADLRGSWTRARTEPNGSRAQNTYLTNRASRAENVRYDAGRVIGRDGFIAGNAATGKMTTMYQWLAYDGYAANIIVTFENGAIRIRDLVFQNQMTCEVIAGGYGITVVEAGTRVYISVFAQNFTGATEMRVLFPILSGDNIDNAFMGPMTVNPTVSEPYEGFVTAGQHKFGYIVTSRSGAQLKPSPYMSAIFNPLLFTTTGNMTARVQVSAVWPQDAAFVSAVMNTVELPEKFFIVPGTELAVIPGQQYTVQLDCSITDEVLLATGTEILGNFDYFSQMGGVGPLKPFNLAMLGRRLCLFTGDNVYLSDQDDFERITPDQHMLQVPGQRWMVTGAQIRGVNYFFGPKWTYGAVDNEDVPVLWSAPYVISQTLGTTAIHGVCVTTKGDMCWVANEQGLYDFEGSYKDVPVSDMNSPEWFRINWVAAPTTLWIVDDTIEQRVMVFAPLDGATDNSHRLTWSYARGRGSTDVDFSLDPLPASSAAMVREQFTQRQRLWQGPPAAAPILVEERSALADNGVAFIPIWESGEVFKRRREASSIDMKVHAVEVKAKGFGILRSRVYEAGRGVYEDLATETLRELPRDAIEMGCDVMSHDVTVEFKTNQAGERMDISDFTVFHVPWITNR